MIKMILKNGFQDNRVLVSLVFDRIMLDSKIQIKYIDTQNQLADILTKGSLTCDKWNIFGVCLTLDISVLQRCSEVMAKRLHQDS